MLSPRVVAALVAAYVAATAMHVGYIVAHEPFAFDAWNVAFDTHSQPFSVGRFFDFWRDQYLHANPRLGQPFSYLAYKLTGFAEVMTPLALLALTYAVTTLGLGRLPRRGRDLALWAVAIGFAWFVLPQLGRNLFSRAYSANYVYTAALQLWFLVPLRLATGARPSTRTLVLYGLAGVLAGTSNEHTGPTLALIALATAGHARRVARDPHLALAGAIGVAIGFAIIFFAPGQGERYGELAQQVSLPLRVAQRGPGGLLDIVRSYLGYAAPLLALAAVLAGVHAWRGSRSDTEVADGEPTDAVRAAWRLALIAMAAGLVVTATLFVSPKLGSRFFLVPMAWLLAAFIALLDAYAPTGRALRPWLALAVIASIYAVVRTVPVYRDASANSDRRLAMLTAAAPGDTVVADAFGQVEESWWFIGDDYRDWRKRDAIASYLGLARVGFRKPDLGEPLGVAGVRLVPTVRCRANACPPDDAELDIAIKDGFDLEGMRVSVRDAVARRQRASGDVLERYELAVAVPNLSTLQLPRNHLVIARYADGVLVSHVGKLARTTRSAMREVTLPASLTGQPFEIYVQAVTGGRIEPARRLGTTNGEPLRYTPWHRGVYWVLACDATECWVVAATRQGA